MTNNQERLIASIVIVLGIFGGVAALIGLIWFIASTFTFWLGLSVVLSIIFVALTIVVYKDMD